MCFWGVYLRNNFVKMFFCMLVFVILIAAFVLGEDADKGGGGAGSALYVPSPEENEANAQQTVPVGGYVGAEQIEAKEQVTSESNAAQSRLSQYWVPAIIIFIAIMIIFFTIVYLKRKKMKK